MNIRSLTTAFLLTLFTSSGFAQNCCSNSTPSTTFAMLTHDKKFTASHAEPLAFKYVPKEGTMVTFKTPDGKKSKAFFIESAVKTNKYIFVFHEWWGLNDYIKKTAEELQNSLGDVNVLALDLFDGQVTNKAELAGQLVQQVKAERCMAIVMGAGTFAGDDAQIQTVGWCFGGSWSMQAAEILKTKTKRCVIYYGMPEKDPKEIAKINFPVLGIFAAKDEWVTPQVAADFEKAMKSAEKSVEIKSYDADHAFANPSNPKHNKEFADDAMKLTVEFLKKNL